MVSHRERKISSLIKSSLVTSETYYSSDSDCEYTISVEVARTEKPRELFFDTKSDTLELKIAEGHMLDILNENNELEIILDNDPGVLYETTINVDKLQCKHCPQNFTTEKNLKQHVKMYHVAESGIIDLDLKNMESFICPECSKQLKDMRCLKKHLKLCHNLIVDGLIYNSSHKSKAPSEPAVVRNSLSNQFPIIRDRSPTSGKPRTKCGICGHGFVYGCVFYFINCLNCLEVS